MRLALADASTPREQYRRVKAAALAKVRLLPGTAQCPLVRDFRFGHGDPAAFWRCDFPVLLAYPHTLILWLFNISLGGL